MKLIEEVARDPKKTDQLMIKVTELVIAAIRYAKTYKWMRWPVHIKNYAKMQKNT